MKTFIRVEQCVCVREGPGLSVLISNTFLSAQGVGVEGFTISIYNSYTLPKAHMKVDNWTLESAFSNNISAHYL